MSEVERYELCDKYASDKYKPTDDRVNALRRSERRAKKRRERGSGAPKSISIFTTTLVG